MENKEYLKYNSFDRQKLNEFREKEVFPQFNAHNNFIYGDKNDSINEDIYFKQKEDNEIIYLERSKSSIDINFEDKNIHEFLNEDLIKALDNDLMELEENNDLSDSSSSNAYISGSSENNTNSSTPIQNFKLPKNEKDINMNLNFNLNCQNKNKNIKEKIKILNNPLFTPIIIPTTINNIEKYEQNKEKKEQKKESDINREKKNDYLKNKFDDDVEPIIMLSMTNEEKTKLPLEIRIGDWICLYCNNLNFSFRVKCNRCGLLRKSTEHLLNKKYFNKYQYMANRNYMNFNPIFDSNDNKVNNDNYKSFYKG